MSSKRGIDRTGKRKAARYKFRAIVRTVILNRKWLEDAEEQKLSLNYKKNIAILIRTEQKIGVLTMHEKALIRQIHEFRTVQDRQKLVHLLAKLLCFANIPPKLRARLVPVIKFLILEPGRVLMREGYQVATVYFILCGEVEASKKVYDPKLKQYTNKVEYLSGPGDCIGDIDFYEKREKREFTYVATMTTEVLVVFEDDFDRILRPYMAQQWDNKKAALKSLEYFNFFDAEQIRTACRLGVLRQYNPLENIYSEDKGAVSYVHFVLCGECMILQRLKVKVRNYGRQKAYKLVNILPATTSTYKGYEGKVTVDIMKQLKLTTDSNMESQFMIESNKALYEIEQEDNLKQRLLGQEELIKVEAACQRQDKSNVFFGKGKSRYSTKSTKSHRSMKSEKSRRQKKSRSEKLMKIQELNDNDTERASIKTTITYKSLYDDDDDDADRDSIKTTITYKSIYDDDEEDEAAEEASTKRSSVRNKSISSIVAAAPLKTAVSMKSMTPSTYTGEYNMDEKTQPEDSVQRHSKKVEETKEFREEEEEEELAQELSTDSSASSSESSSSASSLFATDDITKSRLKQGPQKTTTENHLIDVGSIYFHGVFGLGEELIDRVIMARTVVQCLLLPRFWLFEKDQNPANAWGRRRFYIDSNIPSRQALFENFLKTRKWQAFKTEYVQSHIKDFVGNQTKKQDIPIIGHIVEDD